MVYGLQHGRLHIQPTAMWMNMGYWSEDAVKNKTMAEACRDLHDEVLAQAGFNHKTESAENVKVNRRARCLIDLGIGCGDQTIHVMSKTPIRPCDEAWWGKRDHNVMFDSYIGITNDSTQAQYASERVEELKRVLPGQSPAISVFCADASQPEVWDAQVHSSIQTAQSGTQETWVLALDTAYHFSPSRWPLINYACQTLRASFMAFDLCLSPTATFRQRLTLRILTMLMGAPWTNFVTPEQYRQNLIAAGYEETSVSVVDVSEHVFSPLAKFMEEQDRRLKMLGLGLGRFKVARKMFAWWGRSGVVRGVVVVAKQRNDQDEL
ncbi:hypothetical protein P153DRAFT_288267 [Dothidotthia symphoricarpi CBS 119687]|uniref:S-adenosyl-L-methionine-dependent methyltransferase n=1 Tax=Dothidotthia symphoricarpi CBS 119687 TaxID=1392245 RepID=A0A6A6AGN8_9PLEO|nr:uncharacterized protein P153DRAFT_288267 [Dothidotthia symphoricarpi CBS 119687]KAF2130403.1 hypothetical protein P153DRAFT_288267 [Dothidotthia symphoricarpi CBS 119687]